jgi:hypothetical protein
MIIGLAGTHRSGKSTLARAVSARHGIAYYDGSFGRIAKTFGYNAVAAMTPYERVTMQFAVLERFASELDASGPRVITDRTPIDMLAYMMAEIGMHAGLDEGTSHAIVRYRERCIATTRELFGAVFLLQPLPTYVAEDGKPSGDPAYQMHIQTLIEGGLFALRHGVDVMPIDALSREQRIRDVEVALRLPAPRPGQKSADALGTVEAGARNDGYSLGLEHPYIYALRGDRYAVWHRHTGAITWLSDPAVVGSDDRHAYRARQECYRQNGLNMQPSPDEIAALDATP